MFSRRRFVKLGAASVGSLALRNFGLMPALAAQASDYKALVCIFLFGGADTNNMVIPVASIADYQKYRGSLVLSGSQLQEETALNGADYYFHSGLTELASLFGQSQSPLAVVANVGPLVKTTTKANIATTPIPSHLFSHSDQQKEWQTADPTEAIYPVTGWGGRTADQVDKNTMNAGQFPTFLSVAGADLFGVGLNPQVELNPGGSLTVTGYNPTTILGQTFYNLLQTDSGLALAGFANGTMLDGIKDGQMLATALKGVSITSNFAASSLGLQLKQVAQIIKARENLNMQRQIFFCSLGGFDTHYNELGTLNKLFPILSQAMNDFNNCVANELNLADSVTTFTESDFSRTYVPSTTDGSDHAWGSNHLVMGGAVTGGTIYGTFPTFVPGGENDYDSGASARGRWIPTNAVDQYGASLVNWFAESGGKSIFTAGSVFPNLANFPGTPTLNFMKSS